MEQRTKQGRENTKNTNKAWTHKKNKRTQQNKYSKKDILSGIIIETVTIQKVKNRDKSVINQKLTKEALPDIETPKITHKDIPQDINDPILALYDENLGKPIDFDDAIEKLKNTQALAEDEEFVYIGKGEFAVIAYVESPIKTNGDERENGRNKGRNFRYRRKTKKVQTKVLEIRRKVVFEKHREDLTWRDELCFGLSLFYKPNPRPLSELYTEEEEKSFFRFN